MDINIYGMKDTGNNWFWMLDDTHRKLGHRPISADPCVQYKANHLGSTITVTYTDDVIGALDTEESCAESVKEIEGSYDFRFYGEPDIALGITIRWNAKTGNISLHQQPLITKIIESYSLENAMPQFTPLPSNLTLIDSQPSPIPTEDAKYM
uniref:Reverse transcriptase Ty1/copia-type domain-containing protein n=1 Tax=Moniliophthora roreri TaxID=221103 RepID=A0A0W0F418_MONRR